MKAIYLSVALSLLAATSAEALEAGGSNYVSYVLTSQNLADPGNRLVVCHCHLDMTLIVGPRDPAQDLAFRVATFWPSKSSKNPAAVGNRAAQWVA